MKVSPVRIRASASGHPRLGGIYLFGGLGQERPATGFYSHPLAPGRPHRITTRAPGALGTPGHAPRPTRTTEAGPRPAGSKNERAAVWSARHRSPKGFEPAAFGSGGQLCRASTGSSGNPNWSLSRTFTGWEFPSVPASSQPGLHTVFPRATHAERSYHRRHGARTCDIQLGRLRQTATRGKMRAKKAHGLAVLLAMLSRLIPLPVRLVCDKCATTCQP
jgi:hypothetical protein